MLSSERVNGLLCARGAIGARAAALSDVARLLPAADCAKALLAHARALDGANVMAAARVVALVGG